MAFTPPGSARPAGTGSGLGMARWRHGTCARCGTAGAVLAVQGDPAAVTVCALCLYALAVRQLNVQTSRPANHPVQLLVCEGCAPLREPVTWDAVRQRWDCGIAAMPGPGFEL